MGERSSNEKTTTLISLVEQAGQRGIVAIFGKTGAGKTTFCKALTLEAARADYHVIYIDTEDNATDLSIYSPEQKKSRTGVSPEDLLAEKISYYSVESNDELVSLLDKLRMRITKQPPSRKILLIVDSIAMPSLVQWAESRRYDERGIAALEQIRAVARVKKFVKKLSTSGYTATAVLVLHPVSDMTITRELQQVARKLAEQEAVAAEMSGGSRSRRAVPRISIDSLPEEIILQHSRPSGGKSLHAIKEIWLSRKEASGTIELLENNKMLDPDEVDFIYKKLAEIFRAGRKSREGEESFSKEDMKKLKMSKFRIYAWRSRLYPDIEPLVDMYIVDLLGEPVVLYRVLAQVRNISEFRLRVVSP